MALELLCRVWREVEAWALPRTAPSVTCTGILGGAFVDWMASGDLLPDGCIPGEEIAWVV